MPSIEAGVEGAAEDASDASMFRFDQICDSS
jgi:hypothetical protein